MADVTTARQGIAGRKRVRADIGAETGVGSDGDVYRTFPARLPVVLTALGGSFAALGGLGAVVRATALATAREGPKQVGVIMGYHGAGGWLVAILGLVLIAASFAWAARRAAYKLAAAGLSIALGVITIARLVSFDARASELATAAKQTPDFIGYHAGFGWGSWCMLVGAIFAGFGLLVGILREIDLRRGIPG